LNSNISHTCWLACCLPGTHPYTSVHISTHQYNSAHISIQQYTAVHISVHTSIHHYSSIHINAHQYTSVFISTHQYTSEAIRRHQLRRPAHGQQRLRGTLDRLPDTNRPQWRRQRAIRGTLDRVERADVLVVSKRVCGTLDCMKSTAGIIVSNRPPRYPWPLGMHRPCLKPRWNKRAPQFRSQLVMHRARLA
jgi:hypothetical protein